MEGQGPIVQSLRGGYSAHTYTGARGRGFNSVDSSNATIALPLATISDGLI